MASARDALRSLRRRLLWPMQDQLLQLEKEARDLRRQHQQLHWQYRALLNEIEANRVLAVQPRIREFRQLAQPIPLAEAEFRVFSQAGQDGIIQYLISRLPIPNPVFVEFGVQTYAEASTRFLLVNDNWSGLVMDTDQASVDEIRAGDLYWRHDLLAQHRHVTRGNINSLLAEAGLAGDIGLLCVDIDGNDYWVWQALDAISPRIVVIEYNSLYGSRHAVTVPYQDDFYRTSAHYSNLYYGASLKALCLLAGQKGYAFAGCNRMGNDAFFVRRDLASAILTPDCDAGYVRSRFRQSRDPDGRLTHLSFADSLRLIEDCPVVNVENGVTSTLKELGPA